MTAAYGVPPPRYRLPDATRIGRVRLQVADLQRSLVYYQQVIGLRVVQLAAGRAWLGPHDDTRVLVELHERRGAKPVPQHGRYGLYHFAILVPDRQTLGRFVAHLAGESVRVASADHLVSEALYLWDPDGLGIEVYADRPRNEWQRNGRELAMTTAPLDLRGLIRAAGDDVWEGLPRGTVIGHVHLHVGDLARAEAMYHAALGFDKMVWSYPGALFLAAGGYHHHLGTNTWVEGASSPGDDEAQLIEWELVVPAAGVEAAAASLRHGGFAVSDDGDDRVAADPWGTRVRIVGDQEARTAP
jgi:catechol 2,3-dioxygenase